MAQGRLCNRDGLILTAMVSYPCAVLVYSYGFGSLLLLPPLVFFSFRSRSLPPLTSLILYKMGLLGLIVNVNPAFTFIFAVIFRMEKLAIRKESSLAKVHIGLLEVAFLLFRTFFTPSLTLLWYIHYIFSVFQNTNTINKIYYMITRNIYI
ncbi:unnamed protein product [Brassica napus]|uniref:(rape) hypothetical protein n=1 Tax=Brassica napus TaxID=3708 RepID=A0A816IR89_BRANA|nr:unnamed protein product [Brassica napus]